MLDNLTKRGVWVQIKRSRGEAIEGWLIGEIAQGLLVALDEDLTDIRLVSEYYSITYNHEKKLSKLIFENAEEVYEELRTTSDAISDLMRGAISRIKFDRLHQFGHRSAELHRQLHSAEYELKMRVIASTSRDELMGFLIAQADRATVLHREVYETLEDSGLTSILDEFGPRLTHLPSELTIPAYDLEFFSMHELTSTLESVRKKRWTGKKHRVSLEAAEATRTQLIDEAIKELCRENNAKPEKPDDSTRLSRWFGPTLRILAGTGLATANAAVGITAGLTSTIVTIGATAVPTYVGVATSIYTGLAQVADGLEKIGRSK